jgi:nitrogenase molybdenum-iron protein alpha/beta subunit
MGVYLAVNAIEDVWLVVDGPDCAHFKGQFISGRHDWCSTLFRVDGRHRILFTGTNAQNVSWNREAEVTRMLERAAHDRAGAVLLTSMPICGITGVQYDRIVDGLDVRPPVVEVPGRSLRGDWLDGYASTLAAIARSKDPTARPDPDAVAIVGHLMERGEGDQRGNLAELGRMLGALGLTLVSVWPGGGSWSDLDAAGRAGAVISLPYGREAARILAGKTGARLVETDVPIGLEGTRRWVETVAGALGRQERARTLVDAELGRAAARLERTVPFYFLGRSVHLVCDPHVLGGLAGLCTDLGMRVRIALVTGRQAHLGDVAIDAPVVCEPMIDDPYPLLRDAGAGAEDLVVCSGEYAHIFRPRMAVVELGVPSSSHHVLTDTPFLGFTGALHLAERMANALHEARDLLDPR